MNTQYQFGYIVPPRPGELPMTMPNGDRYSVNLTERRGKDTVVIGELYSSCTGDAETAIYCQRRTLAIAAMMTAAPEMYAFLERQLRSLNPEGCTAQIIRRILAKARGEETK